MDRSWYIACQSAELLVKPMSIRIASRPIVLFRDQSGHPAALEDRCLHRGAPLSGGCVVEKGLACPYHGWRYGADGLVTHIPSQGGGTIPSTFRIPAFCCVEQDGFVWIAIQPPASEPRRFPFQGERGWHSFCMKTTFHAPVEACLENFLDCPHATSVHQGWFRSPTARPVKAIVRTLADGAEAEYFDEPRERSAVWALLAPSRRNEMRHTDRFIAPSTTEVDYQFTNRARYLITSVCTPVDDETTLVHTVITFRFGWLTPLIALIFRPLARQIIRQDVDMLNRTQANARRFGRPSYRVIPQDLLYPHIVQWRTALRQGAETPAATSEVHVDLCL